MLQCDDWMNITSQRFHRSWNTLIWSPAVQSGHQPTSDSDVSVILKVVFVNKRLQGLDWFGLCEGHWWFSFPWTSIYFPGNQSRFEIGNFQSTKPQVLFFVLSFVEFIWLFGTARRLTTSGGTTRKEAVCKGSKTVELEYLKVNPNI